MRHSKKYISALCKYPAALHLPPPVEPDRSILVWLASRMSSVQRAQTHPERTRRRLSRGPLSVYLQSDLRCSSALAEGRTNTSPSWRATGPPGPNGRTCTSRMHLQHSVKSVKEMSLLRVSECVVTAVYHWRAQGCCRTVRDSLAAGSVSAEPEHSEYRQVVLCYFTGNVHPTLGKLWTSHLMLDSKYICKVISMSHNLANKVH